MKLAGELEQSRKSASLSHTLHSFMFWRGTGPGESGASRAAGWVQRSIAKSEPAERVVAERAAWCSGRVVARAAAVGNAVAARQVIVIGAAVPLSRRPSLSARTRTLAAVCVLRLAHRSFFSRSRRRLTPRRSRRSRFLRCGGWRPPGGGPARWGDRRWGQMHSFLF